MRVINSEVQSEEEEGSERATQCHVKARAMLDEHAEMEAVADLGGTVVAGPVLKACQQRAAKRIQLLLHPLLQPLAHV